MDSFDSIHCWSVIGYCDVLIFTGLIITHSPVFIIPLPAVLVMISPDYQYSIFQFPPLFCIPNNLILFYSLTMVLDIVSAEGLVLLILMLGMVSKV